jgi:hypothetical protein
VSSLKALYASWTKKGFWNIQYKKYNFFLAANMFFFRRGVKKPGPVAAFFASPSFSPYRRRS